jgi:MATE family multidrug resistance protein
VSLVSGSQRPSRTRSLSWSRQPLRELLRLSWPITVSLLSFGVMTLVDTLFVSTIGTSALAGVGLAGTATFALYCFSFGLLRGTKVLVSQSIGAGRRDELGAHLGAAIGVAIVLGLLTALLGHFVSSFLPLIAASDDAGRAAESYLAIRTLGAPVVLTFVAVREYRYGESDTRSPMIAGLVGNTANIALNWLLVIHMHLGVRGSATATLFGHTLELFVVLYAQSRHGFPIAAARLRHVIALVRVGIPTGIQFLLEMGSFAMLTAIVSSLGETQMAAHQIALQVIHFSFLPTVALAEAGSVLAGQAVGAGRDLLVRRVARDALLASSLYTGFWTLLLVFFGSTLVSIFTAEAGLSAVALSLLQVAALFQIADGAATVARGVLRGAGDVIVPARLGVLCAWCCTPPLAYFLGRVMGFGALGGWLGLLLEISVLAALCWIRLRGNAWLPLAAAARARLRRDTPPGIEVLPAETSAG